MNIQSQFARFADKTQSVERCVARHDGGYLIRLADGRSGVSHAPLAQGARAVLTQSGAVEAAR